MAQSLNKVLWTVEFDRKKYSRQKVRRIGRRLHQIVPEVTAFYDACSFTFEFENEEQAEKLKPQLTAILKIWDSRQ